jgi:hypothetical protein
VKFVAPKKGMATNFFRKFLFLRFLDPGSEIRDLGSGMGKKSGSGIGVKHHGSATLAKAGKLTNTISTNFCVFSTQSLHFWACHSSGRKHLVPKYLSGIHVVRGTGTCWPLADDDRFYQPSICKMLSVTLQLWNV